MSDPATLTISWTSRELTFELADSSRSPLQKRVQPAVWGGPAPDALYTRLLASLSLPPWEAPGSEAAELLAALGAALGRTLPDDLERWMERTGPDWLLELGDSDLPWDLASLGEQPLWRKLRSSRPLAVVPRRSAAALQPPYRAVLAADPEGLLPVSAERLTRLAEILGAQFEVVTLTGPQLTRRGLVQALASKPVHLLVLGLSLEVTEVPRSQPPLWQHRLLLADGPITPRDVLDWSLESPPAIVALDLCSCGQSSGQPGERVRVWARSFLELGSRAVLGNRWDQPGELLEELVRGLVYGQNLSVAFQQARMTCLRREPGDPYLSAQAWLHFGAPALQFPGLGAQQLATLDSGLRARYKLHFLEGPEEGRQVTLYAHALMPGRTLSLGSQGLRPVDIEIEDPELENQVASLEADETGGLWLASLSPRSELVQINGLAVHDRVRLFGGEKIRLGQHNLLELRAAGASPAQPELDRAAPPHSLQVVAGLESDLQRRFRLNPGVTTVGRLPTCDVQLSDPAVSRQHLTILCREGFYYLNHLGTRPTIVNGVLVDRERELNAGDLIQLSDNTSLLFAPADDGP